MPEPRRERFSWIAESGARRSGLALGEEGNGFLDPPLACLSRFRRVDLHHVATLVTVGERLEECLCLGHCGQGGGEVIGDVHFPRGRVQFEIDLDRVTTGDPCGGTVFGA
jgi:hypothetical protein